ncbi:MAG: Ig-like domain-containing protein [Panacagrimonas sp.]
MATGEDSVNFNGTDSFTYQANDGSANSNAVTATLIVEAINDAPVAAADRFEADEDRVLDVPARGVLVNDTDADSDALTASLVAGPSHGSLMLNSDGSFRYTSEANFSGTDTFSYRAGDGQEHSATVTVALMVNEVSENAPVAAADNFSLNEDGELSIGAPGVLGNDTDPDGGALTAVLVAGPPGGRVTLNVNGSFHYTPAPNFNGTETFTYRASNASATSSTATVTLTVNAINDAPGISSRAPSLAFDSRPFVHDVTATDIDDTRFSFSLSGAPAGMRVSNAGRIIWTPPSGATTSGRVTITVADGGENGAVPAQQVFTLAVRPDTALIGLADINRNRAQDLAVLVKDGGGLKLHVKDGLDGATMATRSIRPASRAAATSTATRSRN